MKDKLIRSIFWAMVAFFLISILSMFILVPIAGGSPLRISVFATLPIFFGLGVALLVLTVKKKVPGLLQKFLLLAGASAAGLPLFGVLHNLVSALFNTEEPVFFILATTACPLGFLVGAVGTIVLSRQKQTA